MARALRWSQPDGLGTGPAFTGVLVLVSVTLVGVGYAFVPCAFSQNWRHLLLCLWLLPLLPALYLAWTVLYVRGAVSASTGAGFLLAACAMSLRVLLESVLSFHDWPLASMPLDSDLPATIALARAVSWVGLAFGIASVITACLAERRLRSMAAERLAARDPRS